MGINKISRTARVLALATMLLISSQSYAYVNHKVSRSETLWGIAYKYKVKPEDIINANPQAANGLKVGMMLRIPEAQDIKNGITAQNTKDTGKKADNKDTAQNNDSTKNNAKNKKNGDIKVVTGEDAKATPVNQKATANNDKNNTTQSKTTQNSGKKVGTIDLQQKQAEKNGTTNANAPANNQNNEAKSTNKASKATDKASKATDKASRATTETKPEVKEPVQKADAADNPNIYIVKLGDTFFSIARKTGVSVNDLMKYNPLIELTKMQEGTAIRLTEDATYINTTPAVTVVDSVVYRIVPEEAATVTNTSGLNTIAVMLPFDVDNETISRQSLLATDFYKGFLMALKKNTGRNNLPVRLLAIDTQCDTVTFNNRLQQLAKENVQLIIAPEDEYQLQKIDDYALQNNIAVLNVLNIKDDSYQNFPNVIQLNINQKMMYDKAIQALKEDFADYTPVILDFQGDKGNKSSFIEELKKQYNADGLKVIEKTVSGKLTEADLKNLSNNGKYVFIPSSGSTDAFNNFSESVVKIIEDNIVNHNYKVFGYPEWIVMKGEQEEMLHRMGATIYARFYMDESDQATKEAINEFIKWYGNQMEDVYPSQGMLGYDVGNMVFSNLQNSRKENVFNKFEGTTYNGLQSTFHLVRDKSLETPEQGGLINNSLYLIEYLPGIGTYARSK